MDIKPHEQVEHLISNVEASDHFLLLLSLVSPASSLISLITTLFGFFRGLLDFLDGRLDKLEDIIELLVDSLFLMLALLHLRLDGIVEVVANCVKLVAHEDILNDVVFLLALVKLKLAYGCTDAHFHLLHPSLSWDLWSELLSCRLKH